MSLEATIQKLLLRLIFSVAVPAAIIVLCLYIFHSMGDIKYLPASGLAFGVGFFVIYLIFKYWIKPDVSKESPLQIRRYFVVFIINLVINIEIIYLLVSHVGIPLLTAQTVAAVVITYESYYAYLSLLNRAGKPPVVRMPKRLEDEIVYYDEDGEEI